MPVKTGKFIIYLDAKKKHRFRLLASNGEIIASGESYDSKAACLKGIKSIQKNAPTAEIIDETVKKEPAEKAKTGRKSATSKSVDNKPAEKKPVVRRTRKKADPEL